MIDRQTDKRRQEHNLLTRFDSFIVIHEESIFFLGGRRILAAIFFLFIPDFTPPTSPF